MTEPAGRAGPLYFLLAFASGGLLTLMVHFNAELGRYGNALFASWTAHGTGTAAALLFLLLLLPFRRTRTAGTIRPPAPAWAYLGGLSGGLTVMLTSYSANTPLALSGTLALGLAGQVAFGLAADRWGLFGMPRRRPDGNDAAALALILAGSALIILWGGRA